MTLLEVMQSWVNFSEYNGKHKYIIDIYNSINPLPQGYKVKYTDEWCDACISAAGIVAGVSNLIGRECSCERHINIFKDLGIWIEDGTIVPEPNYIILYNWDKNYQPNDGFADHIGVVEKVVNGYITVIEGNKNGCVSRRIIPIGYGFIRGYAKYNDKEIDDMTKDEVVNIVMEILKGNNTNVHEWAKDGFNKCTENKIIDGTRPQGYPTREEVALMISRII